MQIVRINDCLVGHSWTRKVLNTDFFLLLRSSWDNHCVRCDQQGLFWQCQTMDVRNRSVCDWKCKQAPYWKQVWSWRKQTGFFWWRSRTGEELRCPISWSLGKEQHKHWADFYSDGFWNSRKIPSDEEREEGQDYFWRKHSNLTSRKSRRCQDQPISWGPKP